MTTQDVDNINVTPRSIVIRCRRCGHRHAVSGDAIVAGLLARSCPRCFPVRDDEPEVA